MAAYEKKQFRRADAAPLRDADVQAIIAARGAMPNAAKAMATKYKISMRRVYEIWNSGGDTPVCGAGHHAAHRDHRRRAPPAGEKTKTKKESRTERADYLLSQV